MKQIPFISRREHYHIIDHLIEDGYLKRGKGIEALRNMMVLPEKNYPYQLYIITDIPEDIISMYMIMEDIRYYTTEDDDERMIWVDESMKSIAPHSSILRRDLIHLEIERALRNNTPLYENNIIIASYQY